MAIDRTDTGRGVVEGDERDNTIDAGYAGDPDGDRIDNGDAILPGESGDDDIVNAGDGDDTVEAGAGDDEVFGGAGDDVLDGGDGDDLILGDRDITDNSPARESFQWSEAPDPHGNDGTPGIDDGDKMTTFTQDTGNVNVTFTGTSSSATRFSSDPTYVDGVTSGDEAADTASSLDDVLEECGSSTYTLDFSAPVENVSFRVNDIDGDGVVHVNALDGDGNPITVTLTAGAGLTLTDTDGVAGADTATDPSGAYGDDTDPDYSLLVEIPGPVSQVTIEHSQDGPLTSGIKMSDVFFDSDPDIAEGDDVLTGGMGDDTLIGGLGNDTALGGEGDDVIDTSNPIIDPRDPDFPLPDRGFGTIIPADPDPDNDRDLVDGGAGNDTIFTGDDADTIAGGAGDDVIDGGLDDDEINAGEGDDFVIGGEGSDTILGRGGDDTIYGGVNDVTANIPDATDPEPDNGRDYIDGGSGDDLIFGEDDDDTILGGTGDDTISGGIDDDLIRGQDGDDSLMGDDGDDTIRGGNGNDVIEGGDGDDVIEGRADNDTIIGGAGADDMSGDTGRDTFIIGSAEDGDGDNADGGSGGDDFDTLDLSGAGDFEIVDRTVDPDGNSVSGRVNFLDAPGGTVTGTMTFQEIERIIPCFTPGTVIATPRGERLVEDLEVGDRVITRDNGLQEVRWIGRRDLAGAELLQARHLKPVLIRAGALGRGLPERDLLVSPNHRVLVNNEKSALYFEDREVLAAAKHLTGLEGVDAVDTGAVSYIHFMFDQHEVVLSNGSWTESFQPGEQTLGDMGEESRDEIYMLFPELREKEGVEAYHPARRSLKKHEARLLTAK
ncbi:type I secretion protein [Roseovarius spongiae]|uniref:Type I secretion protein n=1 Tax=Roseovarius spongiae TaxID=2320272 RepID=A0A3A8AZB6_9RHOB|nr:Hint domain-containing protein [Roseovarius spongiae]RKF16929.1 type I secretion protein [Roseovarius spongiae]